MEAWIRSRVLMGVLSVITKVKGLLRQLRDPRVSHPQFEALVDRERDSENERDDPSVRPRTL